MRDRAHEREPEAEERPRRESRPPLPPILALQQSAGNQAVARMLQRKITLGTAEHTAATAKTELEKLTPKPTITAAHEEWLHRLDKADKTFGSTQELADQLGGTAGTTATTTLPRISPDAIRFSQTTVQSATEGGLSIDDVADSMRTKGFNESGAPDVVDVPGVGYVSVDNRRIVAARRAGLATIPVKLHHFNDPLTDSPERFTLRNDIRRKPDGELTIRPPKTNPVVFAKGTVPATWGEAVLFRTGNQAASFGIYGKLELPKIQAPKTPTTTTPTPTATGTPVGGTVGGP